MAPRPCIRAYSESVVSTATFDAPYGLVGRTGAVSGIGTCSALPYAAAVEEKTIRDVPATRIASSRASVPPRLFDQYLAGFATDSPTCEWAAKCSTASVPSPSAALASARSVPWMNVAPGGTASANPVDRSSRTDTWCPAATSFAATTLPIYPAPPVTSSFTMPPRADGEQERRVGNDALGYPGIRRHADPAAAAGGPARRRALARDRSGVAGFYGWNP